MKKRKNQIKLISFTVAYISYILIWITLVSRLREFALPSDYNGVQWLGVTPNDLTLYSSAAIISAILAVTGLPLARHYFVNVRRAFFRRSIGQLFNSSDFKIKTTSRDRALIGAALVFSFALPLDSFL